MRTPRTEPLYRAAVIARWCDVSCSMLQTFCLINYYTSVVPHVRTCFLNVHTSQIERYIGRILLSSTLGTDLVAFSQGDLHRGSSPSVTSSSPNMPHQLRTALHLPRSLSRFHFLRLRTHTLQQKLPAAHMPRRRRVLLDSPCSLSSPRVLSGSAVCSPRDHPRAGRGYHGPTCP